MIIGVAGYKGHGKDSVGGILSQKGFIMMSFAIPLKKMLMEGLRLSSEQVHGKLKEAVDPRYGVTPRYMMQTLGTQWGRDLIHPELWILASMESARDYGAEGRSVVFTDVRFPNEAAAIRAAGGQVWAVLRPSHPIDTSHESEQHVERLIQEADQLIFNTGSLFDLGIAVDDAYWSTKWIAKSC